MRVLFVCTGNTCRSPLAQAYSVSNFPKSHFQSAGLAARTGAPASEFAQAVGRRHGLDLSRHRSRGIEEVKEADFDLVFGMTKSHCRRLKLVRPDWRILCLGEFLEEGQEIADPFGGSELVYEACLIQLGHALTQANHEFGWANP